jgi:hypothetical protein
MTEEELANRELAVSLAEACMDFIHALGGMDMRRLAAVSMSRLRCRKASLGLSAIR